MFGDVSDLKGKVCYKVYKEGDFIVVESIYDRTLISIIKEMPPHARHWDPDQKVWILNADVYFNMIMDESIEGYIKSTGELFEIDEWILNRRNVINTVKSKKVVKVAKKPIVKDKESRVDVKNDNKEEGVFSKDVENKITEIGRELMENIREIKDNEKKHKIETKIRKSVRPSIIKGDDKVLKGRKCIICKKELDKLSKDDEIIYILDKGYYPRYFCSVKCKDEYFENLKNNVTEMKSNLKTTSLGRKLINEAKKLNKDKIVSADTDSITVIKEYENWEKKVDSEKMVTWFHNPTKVQIVLLDEYVDEEKNKWSITIKTGENEIKEYFSNEYIKNEKSIDRTIAKMLPLSLLNSFLDDTDDYARIIDIRKKIVQINENFGTKPLIVNLESLYPSSVYKELTPEDIEKKFWELFEKSGIDYSKLPPEQKRALNGMIGEFKFDNSKHGKDEMILPLDSRLSLVKKQNTKIISEFLKRHREEDNDKK
jgi:hypothetical protein